MVEISHYILKLLDPLIIYKSPKLFEEYFLLVLRTVTLTYIGRYILYLCVPSWWEESFPGLGFWLRLHWRYYLGRKTLIVASIPVRGNLSPGASQAVSEGFTSIPRSSFGFSWARPTFGRTCKTKSKGSFADTILFCSPRLTFSQPVNERDVLLKLMAALVRGLERRFGATGPLLGS